jgi:hypothetical protein
VPAEIVLCLLTPCNVRIRTSRIELGHAELPGGRRTAAGSIALETRGPDGLPQLMVETIELTDSRLRGIWGEGLRRILLRLQAPGRSGRLALTVAR